MYKRMQNSKVHKDTQYTRFYVENPKREKPWEQRFHYNLQRRYNTIGYNTLCTECISHTQLLASSITQLWHCSRSRLSLPLSHVLYTHTQYGPFANVASNRLSALSPFGQFLANLHPVPISTSCLVLLACG